MKPRQLAIIVKDNAYGLTRDAAILTTPLENLGWVVSMLSPTDRSWKDTPRYKRILTRHKFDTVVHLESIGHPWIGAGKRNFLIPNSECFPHKNLRKLKRFNGILAKTADVHTRFALAPTQITTLGFTSNDRQRNVPKDWNRFLHLAGGSIHKGTDSILSLWQKHPEWPELVLIQKADMAPRDVPANVTLITKHLSDDDLAKLQNTCGMHLCPSRCEGWGHHIVEGMSCGALILTTNAPPMNQHITDDLGVLVNYETTEPRNIGTDYHVTEKALEAQIIRMIDMPDADKIRMGLAARAKYKTITRDFEANVNRIFA